MSWKRVFPSTTGTEKSFRFQAFLGAAALGVSDLVLRASFLGAAALAAGCTGAPEEPTALLFSLLLSLLFSLGLAENAEMIFLNKM